MLSADIANTCNLFNQKCEKCLRLKRLLAIHGAAAWRLAFSTSSSLLPTRFLAGNPSRSCNLNTFWKVSKKKNVCRYQAEILKQTYLLYTTYMQYVYIINSYMHNAIVSNKYPVPAVQEKWTVDILCDMFCTSGYFLSHRSRFGLIYDQRTKSSAILQNSIKIGTCTQTPHVHIPCTCTQACTIRAREYMYQQHLPHIVDCE